MTEVINIRPQPGPQTDFLSSRAFFTLYGGQRGGGKSWALAVDPLRGVPIPRYRATVFRRTFPELVGPGGIWEEADAIYPHVGGSANRADYVFTWKNGSRIDFRHFQDERALERWRGLQTDRALIDEVAAWPERFVWAVIQGTRAGPSGVEPRIKATCNPPGDPDHWLIPLVEPYLTQDGYADRSKSGVVRWFRRSDAGIEWCGEGDPGALSFTFIPANLADNAILEQRDPGYRTRLQNLVSWERERMLHGNWYAAPRSGMYGREQFAMLEQRPSGIRWIRYWDQAGTEPSSKNPNPDYTAGPLIGIWEERKMLVIADVRRFRCGAGEKRQRMQQTAEQDTPAIEIGLEVEPGSSGKDVAHDMVTDTFRGFRVTLDRPTGEKSTRWGPWLSWLEAGRVGVVRGPWNGAFFAEVEALGTKGSKKDQLDGVAGGFKILTTTKLSAWGMPTPATAHPMANAF